MESWKYDNASLDIRVGCVAVDQPLLEHLQFFPGVDSTLQIFAVDLLTLLTCFVERCKNCFIDCATLQLPYETTYAGFPVLFPALKGTGCRAFCVPPFGGWD